MTNYGSLALLIAGIIVIGIALGFLGLALPVIAASTIVIFVVLIIIGAVLVIVADRRGGITNTVK